jgi:hypothetical protein
MTGRIIIDKRGSPRIAGADSVYVGRPSALGNPYAIGGHVAGKSAGLTREETIDLYERWLVRQLASDTPQRRAFDVLGRALAEGRDLVLVCHCRSEPHGETGPACHADVLRRLLAERERERER